MVYAKNTKRQIHAIQNGHNIKTCIPQLHTNYLSIIHQIIYEKLPVICCLVCGENIYTSPNIMWSWNVCLHLSGEWKTEKKECVKLSLILWSTFFAVMNRLKLELDQYNRSILCHRRKGEANSLPMINDDSVIMTQMYSIKKTQQ